MSLRPYDSTGPLCRWNTRLRRTTAGEATLGGATRAAVAGSGRRPGAARKDAVLRRGEGVDLEERRPRP